MSNLSFLIDDADDIKKEITEFYKVLIVDDEESVHTITRMAFINKTFHDKGITLISATSASQAKEVLHNEDDIKLAIIDVVMETPNAGLDLVNYIRESLEDTQIKLIIRTGESNQLSKEEVLKSYDIDEYCEKTELTVYKLYDIVGKLLS